MHPTAKLPIPLHRSILRVAAQPALKGIQARCLSVIYFEYEDIVKLLESDARSLVDVFEDLLTSGLDEDDLVRLNDHRIIEDYTKLLVDGLTDDSLLILSLVTWHFDASFPLLPPPSLLLYFVHSREDSELYEILWGRYAENSGREISLEAFKVKFNKLIGIITKGFFNVLGLS
ncbi:hypothetical protein KXV81_005491 [Aspergillus fumigatus]|nr:hypothetical protein KXX48_005953 [Aspergillus fumigatus]KAH1350435.1 hypothetical protein KXX63_003922 [Aspergillus fumigatus]KAH1383240.1 hypothetical protein KXX49_005564 [Aspergillus fumigatus]KAH1403060.1 hypothetical protein KXX51_001874 [Aspergillus fumigatus]KAH1474820.1 hypothetical protein KXX26_004607 [Aspergillus fumigatus]